MTDVDALAGPKADNKPGVEPVDIGSVADFIEILNATVGKHFKCCICLRSVVVHSRFSKRHNYRYVLLCIFPHQLGLGVVATRCGADCASSTARWCA